MDFDAIFTIDFVLYVFSALMLIGIALNDFNKRRR